MVAVLAFVGLENPEGVVVAALMAGNWPWVHSQPVEAVLVEAA